MNISEMLHIKTTIRIAELKRNPRAIIRISENLPIAILNHNEPEFYLLSAKVYDALLDMIDDTSLIETIKARRGGKTIEVKI